MFSATSLILSDWAACCEEAAAATVGVFDCPPGGTIGGAASVGAAEVDPDADAGAGAGADAGAGAGVEAGFAFVALDPFAALGFDAAEGEADGLADCYDAAAAAAAAAFEDTCVEPAGAAEAEGVADFVGFLLVSRAAIGIGSSCAFDVPAASD